MPGIKIKLAKLKPTVPKSRNGKRRPAVMAPAPPPRKRTQAPDPKSKTKAHKKNPKADPKKARTPPPPHKKQVKPKIDLKALTEGVEIIPVAPKLEANMITQEQYECFFQGLANTAHLTRSAEAAGISRATIYLRKKQEPEFAALIEEAMQIGYDKLIEEAQRRAFDGYDKPVYQQGGLIGMQREYSDALAMFLLKGFKRNMFKDRLESVNVNLDGNQGLSEGELRAQIMAKLNNEPAPSPAPAPANAPKGEGAE